MIYKKLFEPCKIGPLTIKNRGVMVPMGTDFADNNGLATDRLIQYYAERAKGGVGLIINEYTGVDDVDSIPSPRNFRIAQDYHIAECEKLTEAVHQYDCKIFAQLHHAGATSKPALTGRQNLAPSAVPMAPGGPVPKAMSLEDIKRVQQKFIAAAVRCKKAGYDGVELHGAHSYLLAQFASKYYNRRTDEYGGSLENRLRFISEIIDGIRAVLGSYPISVRICGDEMTPIEGFLTLEDGLAIGKYLEGKGIDVINISNGSALNGNANCDPYSYTPGWKKHIAKAFKDALSIPVIATNTIKNPDFAEQLLEEGVCDFVGLGRAHIADPAFINKAKAGRATAIRKCIGCMYCRERLLGNGMPVSCAINPRTGREYLYQEYRRDGAGRKVVVIGGGPAGMEASLVLAKRGFNTILLEKTNALGGTMNIADKPTHKQYLTQFTETMEAELKALDVDIRLGTEATVDIVRALNPEGVIVATGAVPIVPKLPGADRSKVVLAEDVILGKAKVSGKVAVIGTGLTGLETAEMLGRQGAELILVEMQANVGPGIYSVVLNDLMRFINQYNPAIYTNHKLIAVTEPGITVENMLDGHIADLEADYAVLALGVRANNSLVAALEAVFDKVSVAGDAYQPGRIATAVKQGFDRAFVFE